MKFSIPGFESAEQKAKRIAAKQAAEAAKRAEKEACIAAKKAAWARFWFQVKATIAIVFFSFFGLIAWAMYVSKDRPVVQYTAPASSGSSAASGSSVASGAPVPTAPANNDEKPKKHSPASDGDYKEGFVEKVYEKATGKEVVHKKDGTTYERKKPKR